MTISHATPESPSGATTRDSRAGWEFLLALAGVWALGLPLMTWSVSYGYSSSSSGSVSVADFFGHTNWTQYTEIDLVVLGAAGAAALAFVRLFNPHAARPRIVAFGFAALAVGMAWMATETNSANSFISSVYNYGSVSTGISPGSGLWLGLAAGSVGWLVCMTDRSLHAPTLAVSAPIWTPTHRIAEGGTAVWHAQGDPSRPSSGRLPGHLELVVESSDGAWALVRDINGWKGWVDVHALVPQP